jgi:type I restriction enzyme R subunit
MYIRFYRASREENQKSKENVNDDVSFEIELIKQEEINADYILNLIKQYHEKKKKKETLLNDINRAI